MKKIDQKETFLKTVPVMFGYLFLGFAFGILMEQAGFHVLWAFFISLFVYAGSMQFVLVTFLSVYTPLPMVIAMTFLINGRHIFYGLSFVDTFKKMGKKYLYMIFSLTDETYSVLCSVKEDEENRERKLFLISLLDHGYWIFGSVLGALFSQVITLKMEGIEFSMTALFTVIFIEQWMEYKTHIPAITGLLCAMFFLIVLGPDQFMLPTLVVSVAILLGGKKKISEKLGVA